MTSEAGGTPAPWHALLDHWKQEHPGCSEAAGVLELDSQSQPRAEYRLVELDDPRGCCRKIACALRQRDLVELFAGRCRIFAVQASLAKRLGRLCDSSRH